MTKSRLADQLLAHHSAAFSITTFGAPRRTPLTAQHTTREYNSGLGRAIHLANDPIAAASHTVDLTIWLIPDAEDLVLAETVEVTGAVAVVVAVAAAVVERARCVLHT
jgi:hypothetical protein